MAKVVTIKKKYLTHTGSTYQVTYKNGIPEECCCIKSQTGLIPVDEVFKIDEKQIRRQLDFGLWVELEES